MSNEEIYKSMSGTEVGEKLEALMNLASETISEAGKHISDIHRMTENYEQYLHEYGAGGDWTIEEFIKSIAKKSAKAIEILEIEDDEKHT